MPFNGSGSYTPPAASFPYVAATLIESAKVNAVINDIATALTTAITKDGQTTITANLPMAGFRHTGVGNGVARSDYTAMGQTQDGTVNWVVAGGTADALTATYAPTITALVDGQLCYVRAGSANATTTPTFAPNGLTAHTITKLGGSAVVAGEWATDQELNLRYKLASTRWELLNPRKIANADVTGLDKHGADIASAATVNLDTSTGDVVDVTGTTTITAITLSDGVEKTVRFTGILTLTNGASLVLPTGANITTAAGDFAIFRGYAAGVVRCVDYIKKSGQPIATTLTGQTISGAVITNSSISGTVSGGTYDSGTINNTTINGTTTLAPSPTVFRSAQTTVGTPIFQVSDGTRDCVTVSTNADGTAFNAANCVLAVRQAAGTVRSINAAGTINASGADYAEYERKRGDCGIIVKGQIVGFDADGLLTDKFSLAVSFGVKSTTPNLVGGDTWGADLRPCPPPPVEPTDETQAAWEADRAAWQSEYETTRAPWDRIAYCGKVPVNVQITPPNVGLYVSAALGENDTIIGVVGPNGENSVGRIRKRLDDGRALVAVSQ